jgi:hypothetical protein
MGLYAGRTRWSKGMICLVAITKILQYLQKVFSPLTSLTPSHTRQTFVCSPALATFILFSFPFTSEQSSQRPWTGPWIAPAGFLSVYRNLPEKIPRKSPGETETRGETARRSIEAALPFKVFFLEIPLYDTKLT